MKKRQSVQESVQYQKPQKSNSKIALQSYTREECYSLIHAALVTEKEELKTSRAANFQTWTLEETYALMAGCYDPRNFSKKYNVNVKTQDLTEESETQMSVSSAV